jgi:hypothetical protein
MPTLFDSADREAILKRLEQLEPGATRQWGTMDPAQMLAHCSLATETGTGERPMKQKLLGRLVMPFIRSIVLGDGPFRRNAPTDPTFVVSDPRDFAAERARLTGRIDRFCQRGPAEAGRQAHPFFGALTGEEWGRLVYKHLDHHLRQFGV